MTKSGGPERVAPESVRRRIETSDGGFEVGVVIDQESHGSPLLLGLEWVKPRTEAVSWTADEKTHETYYVERGRLRIRWDGDQSGEATVGPTDSFYFPPGLTYSVENVGDDDVFVVWSLVPSPSPN
jgi:mannose-6-phosphate isomerase-like protein (cupin superfamily)